MRSSSEQINSSFTEELSWTDEESGSDHSLAENEVMLYSLLHHKQQDSTVPETTLDITTCSRTKANRLNRVQYVTEQYNGMATKKSFGSNNFGRRNLSTFNGFSPNRYSNKCTEMASKNVEGTKKRKRPARLKTKKKQNRNVTSVQSLLKEVYKLSADTSLENVMTLYDSTSEGPSTPLTSLSLNVTNNASNECALTTRKNKSIQSVAAAESQPASVQLSGTNIQTQVYELSDCSPEKDRTSPSKYKIQLNYQKRKNTVLYTDIITLDSDNESIDSIIEVKPPTPPPPLVISIDSSDESSKTPVEKNKIVESFSKSKEVSTPECIDQITITLNDSNRNIMAESNAVTNEGAAVPVTKDTAPQVISEDTAPLVSNEELALPVCNEETALPVCNEETALPVSNDEITPHEEIVLPVSNDTTAIPVINVGTALPGPSTDSPVFVGESVRKNKSRGPWSTPHSWTRSMIKFYCDSWGGHNFDHQKLISQMSGSREKWIVRDADFRPQVKNRRFCNHCRQRGHVQWECLEERKVPLCFMCGESGHSEPWCPNKICLVCGRPSGAFLYGCQNCYLENQSCAACGEMGHYVWQCPTAWRSYHSTTSVGAEVMPELLKDYRKQECCNCAKRGHSAFWCPSVHNQQLPRQLPARPIGNRNRSMAKGAHNPNNVNNVRVGTLHPKINPKSNKQLKINQRRKERLARRNGIHKQRRIKRKQKKAEKKAEKLAQLNV